MSSKVVLVKYVARMSDSAAAVDVGTYCDNTAIVIKKVRNNFLSIQGYPPISYAEKHKAWAFFQQSVRQLLGIQRDLSICIRFAAPPQETVGNMSVLFQEPSNVINLVVHPIGYCKTAPNSPTFSIPTPSLQISEGKDPYCVFRERYCNGKRDGSVKAKYDFTEMNRLISKLDELNIYLHRTQQVIAEKCVMKTEHTDSISQDFSDDGTKTKKTTEHVHTTILWPSSGKGSILDSEGLEDIREIEEEVDCEQTRESYETEDQKVEQLLLIAHRLTQQIQHQQRKTGAQPLSVLSTSKPSPGTSLQSEHPALAPDAPSQVLARASFRHGGAYIMWDTVSLDDKDMNNGHRVLGYHIYVDQLLSCKVEGPLTAQVELTGLENDNEYIIQVCTECEGDGCTSELTPPLIYRHHETNRLLTSGANQVSSHHLQNSQSTNLSSNPVPLTSSKHCKVARVHTWLKNNSNPDDLDNAHPQDQTPLHVHFADDETCTCADDAKSTGSSQTSGIVTDFPMSPKLISSCTCSYCSDFNADALGNSKLSMPNVVCEEKLIKSGCGASNSVSQSASLPSIRKKYTLNTPTVSLIDQSCINAVDDDDIDQPMLLDVKGLPLRTPANHLSDISIGSRGFHPASNCGNEAGRRGMVGADRCRHHRVGPEPPSAITNGCRHHRVRPEPLTPTDITDGCRHHRVRPEPLTPTDITDGCRHHRVGPEPPTDVTVFRRRKGEAIIVSWNPVKRDKKGCSNDYYVLGYRIYINGSFQQSVDGPMTMEAILSCPMISHIQHKMLIHVRTRSIASESGPSNTVVFHHPMYQQRNQQIDTGHRLATYV